jgi:RecJ-like exonuclease
MSIFRTIRKIRTCTTCHGEGRIYLDGADTTCPDCNGEGEVEIFSRVSQAAAVQAKGAVNKQLPPHERVEAKARLEDHEVAQPDPALPVKGKPSKVGKDVIDEE